MSTIALAAVFVRHGDTLFVMGARGGDLKALRQLGVFTPDWATVRETADAIQRRVRHAAEVGQLDAEALREMEDHGAYLFDELIPFELKRWLQQDAGTLTLSLSNELLDLPWELLYTGREVLCHAWAMGRVLQHAQEFAVLERAATPSPRVLIVADPDGGLDASYEEGIALKRRLEAQHDVTLRAADVDASYIRRHARSYDVLHFSGHIDDRGWRMADGPFTRADAERLVGGVHVPRMVFINGCGGVNTGPNQTVDAWIRAGVDHVLGPLYAVPDRLGRDFTGPFYDQLVAGAAIGEAVRQTRRALVRAHGEGATAWGSYVLYGDPRDNPLRTAERPALAAPRRARSSAPTRLRNRGASVPEAEPVRSARTSVFASESAPRATVLDEWLSFGSVVFAILLIAALAAAAIERDAGASFPFVVDHEETSSHER
jgi:hypothetical protein